jgi:hypothetical protein
MNCQLERELITSPNFIESTIKADGVMSKYHLLDRKPPAKKAKKEDVEAVNKFGLTESEVKANTVMMAMLPKQKRVKPEPRKPRKTKGPNISNYIMSVVDYIVGNEYVSNREIAAWWGTKSIYHERVKKKILATGLVDYCCEQKLYHKKGLKPTILNQKTSRGDLCRFLKDHGKSHLSELYRVSKNARTILWDLQCDGYVQNVGYGVWEWVG